MTYVFESRPAHLTFQVNAKTNKVVETRGHYLATQDEETAKAIMKSKMFSEEPEAGLVWLRLKSEDDKEIAKATKPRGRRARSGATGTN